MGTKRTIWRFCVHISHMQLTRRWTNCLQLFNLDFNFLDGHSSVLVN